MYCCYIKHIKKRYRRNAVCADEIDILVKDIPTEEYIDAINRECIICHHCKNMFKLRENEIKIQCNGCDKFFHCHIAGKCRGKDCNTIINNNTHALSYCLDCVNHMTIRDDTCLCNDCVMVESL